MVATNNFWLVATTYAVAVVAAYLLLCLSAKLKGVSQSLLSRRKAAAALVMGLGLAGMFFAARAAAGCWLDINCAEAQPGDGNAQWLAGLWVVVTLLFIINSLTVVWFDSKLDDQGKTLVDSLEHGETLEHSVKERTASLMEANISLSREVGERTAAQEQLAKKAKELERSNRDLDHFASVASHDLQAPLRAIAGFSKLLATRNAQQLDDNGREYLGLIGSSVMQMQQLIDGVLAFARLGQQNQPKEDVALAEVMDDALKRLVASIDERKAVINVASLPNVHGVRIELVQLLQNLVANALKFQPGDSPRVDVSAVSVNEQWQVTVRDYGIGIPAESLQRIFQIFQRLHSSDDFEGSGIGLALCEKIIHHHGGRIWAESVVGEGSAFHFTLPKAQGRAVAS